MSSPLPVDYVIFGGGAAGLWLLDELIRRGCRPLLLEAGDLGAGQTVSSQGIIHGGLKYTLGGLLTTPAHELGRMPERWRRCLAGQDHPDLGKTRLRSEFCFMWRSTRLSSRLSMIGARVGMQTAPTVVDDDGRPEVLAGCPGTVVRVEEQVLEPASLLADLADRNRGSLLQIDTTSGLEFVVDAPGAVRSIRLIDPNSGAGLELAPQRIILTAGSGNGNLLRQVNLDVPAQQRRPLHMVMARGRDLPWLNGHNVDGSATRVTITSSRDCQENVIWQIGGQIAEDGVRMDAAALIRHACSELRSVLPSLNLDGVSFATWRVDRAELKTLSGRRPERAAVHSAGNVITAWPTKLALVPQMVDQVMALLDLPTRHHASAAPPVQEPLTSWPRPAVALPPWETHTSWTPAV